MRTIIHLLLAGAAVLAAAYLLPGVAVQSYGTAIGVALLLGLVTLALGPVLAVVTLPINLATVGLFTLVIMAILVKVVDALMPGLYVQGMGSAILFGLLVAAFDSVIGYTMGRPALTHRP
jgi:putative membrane protein